MKKSLLAISLISSVSAFSQITVTEANVVGVAEQVIQNSDTLPTVSSPTTGANQTWDYSVLTDHDEDTMNFVAPDWLLNFAEFPTANLALPTDQGEIYLRKDATGLHTLGLVGDFLGTGSDITIAINPYESIVEFPLNFNDTYTNDYWQRISVDGATIGFPVDSVVVTSESVKDVTVDSWGSMTTPFGTFDVLGTYETVITIDSTFTYLNGMESLIDSEIDTSYRRSYWSNDPSARFPVMEFEQEGNGDVVTATWLKQEPTADINTLTTVEASAFPNPATDLISINAAAGAIRTVVIYDVNGAVVATKDIVGSHAQIDVKHLAEGTYVVTAFGQNGAVVLTQQVVKL